MTLIKSIPSRDVDTPVVGMMMRRRERMEKEGGDLNGFPAPRADDTMPAQSLYADGKMKFGMSAEDWRRHSDWMRATYDVRTLTLGVYDYVLPDDMLDEWVAWLYESVPMTIQAARDPRNVRAIERYAAAKRAPEGVMYADWSANA